MIPHQQAGTCQLPLHSVKANTIKLASLIIIDEISMLHHYDFGALDNYLRQLMENQNNIFGGKLILASGDFRQMLPVIPNGTQAAITHACVKQSQLWTQVITLHLVQNMRIARLLQNCTIQQDQECLITFDQWLKNIGQGTIPTMYEDIISLDPTIVSQTPDDVINFVYQDFSINTSNASYFKDRALLASTKEFVNLINGQLLKKLMNHL